ASPTGPFREVITDERNGLIANTPDEWGRALDSLLGDVDARARVGERARRDALLELSPHVQGARYLAILERARRRATEPRTRGASGWVPGVLDEPPAEVQLEGYEPPAWAPAAAADAAGAGTTPALHTRLGRLARRGRTVWREEGALAALGAAARRLRRAL